MIVSQKRIDANRSNAQRSTGPRTPEGKARACANALKHGLCAQVLVVEGEQESYRQFVQDLRRELSPASALQEFLFERLAGLAWRLSRVGRLEGWWMQRQEEKIHTSRKGPLGTMPPRNPEARAAWEKRRKQQNTQEPEPEHEPVAGEHAMSWMVHEQPEKLQLIWRYESQLERSFGRTLKQLMEMKQLQEEEPAEEEAAEEPTSGPVETPAVEADLQNEATAAEAETVEKEVVAVEVEARNEAIADEEGKEQVRNEATAVPATGDDELRNEAIEGQEPNPAVARATSP